VPTLRVPDRKHNETADRIAEDDRGRLGALGLNKQIHSAPQYAAYLLGPAHKSNLFQLLRCTLHCRFGSGATASQCPRHVRYAPYSDRIAALRLASLEPDLPIGA